MAIPVTVSGALQVQYLEGGVWKNFGPPMDLGALKRTRRCGLGPRRGVTAQQWRVVKVGATDWDTAVTTLDAIRFWRESVDLSPIKLFSFAFDQAEQRYVLAATDQNVEVYRAGVRVASIVAPHLADQLRLVTKTQVLDTFLQFHKAYAPWRITRQGAHDQWDGRGASFTNIPIYDFTGQRLGGVNEVQRLRFKDFSGGDTFNITLEGETTDSIAYSATAATLAASIQAALQALANIGAGGVTVASLGSNEFNVTFTGANGADDLAEMAPRTLSSAAGGVFAATIAQGKAGGEAVMSANRGWPACGVFYQQRLFLGGMASRPQTVLGSRLGDYFNLDIKGATSAAGLSFDLDTDEATPIYDFFPGQHLQIFTSLAEFHVPTKPIVAPGAADRNTKKGMQQGIQPVELDSATMFVSSGGHALIEFIWDDGIAKYRANNLAKLASHRVSGVVDMAFRRALSADEPDLAVLVRDDGDAAVMASLREDEVTGFTGWSTQGRFLAAVSDIAGTMHVAVRRQVAGVDEIFLEEIDEAAVLDAQVRVVGAGVTQVDVPHLEGRTVVAYIDGADAGDVVVTDGKAVLPYAALREVDVGCLFVPRYVSLPPVLQEDPRSGAAKRERAGEIALKLGPSANLKAGQAGGRLWTVPLKKRPTVLADQGPGENAFTGWTRLQGVQGFGEAGQIEIQQARPGPLEIQEIVVTVES